MELKEEDLKIENEIVIFDNNKIPFCNSFIKATYIPTGLVVICRKHYSQYKNAEECKNIIKDIISYRIEIINNNKLRNNMPIYKIRRTEEVTFSKVFEVEADTKEEALKEVEENEDKVYEIEDNNENYDGTYYESEIED